MIFLTITGTFSAAVIYDKREKKRNQRKWCKMVEHIAREPLDPKAMPRKLTVFLEGPPTDGLRTAQDHFKEYVKPILVASGLDWEFIQGRKEGDIRAELAEKIRTQRTPLDQRLAEEDAVLRTRRHQGITEYDGPKGDIVLGRHTWKEYVRGLHEGWLGPLIEPPKPVQDIPTPATGGPVVPEASQLPEAGSTNEDNSGTTIHTSEPEAPIEEAKSPTPEEEKSKMPTQPPPFISTSAYQSAALPSGLPSEFDPSAPIIFPHILGFFNTPRRLYRFLNRRAVADQIGRETAAIILATYRPYRETSDVDPSSFESDEQSDSPQNDDNKAVPQVAEQQTALIEEEKEWHKSARVRVDGESERTWLEPVVLDPRIASRMRRSKLTPADEIKAKGIVVPEEEIEGWIKGGLRSLGKQGKEILGFGKKRAKRSNEDEVLE